MGRDQKGISRVKLNLLSVSFALHLQPRLPLRLVLLPPLRLDLLLDRLTTSSSMMDR
jgi:hypothetical protein